METKFLLLVLLAVFGNALSNENNNHTKEDINCRSLTAYFVGKFSDPKNGQLSFDAQFQVKFEIADGDKSLIMNRQYWNESMSSSDLVSIQLDTSKHFKRCFGFEKTCTIPFDKDAGFVQITLVNMYPWFYFQLLQPVTSDFSLVLPNSLGGCTNGLPLATFADASQHQADTTLFRYCICCGLYNPNASLNCPVSPLQLNTNNQPAPSPVTKQPPVQTTTTIPAKQDTLTCKSLTIFYTGVLKRPNTVKRHFTVQFQNKFDIDAINKRVFFTNQYWNANYSDANDFGFEIYNNSRNVACPPLKQGCSVHYNDQHSWVGSHIHKKVKKDIGFNIATLAITNDLFTLKNVTGQCSNTLVETADSTNLDTDYYRLCACCGDYNPHPDLLCPDNPWQSHTVVN